GVARGASLRSHDKWCKAVKEYSQAKGLEMPAGISETMDRLRSVVADYRDKQITHFQNPRAFHVTHITREGATQMGTTALYPKDSDKWSTSPAVGEVANLLETYIEQLIQLIESNRGKTRYKLRQQNT